VTIKLQSVDSLMIAILDASFITAINVNVCRRINKIMYGSEDV